MSCEQDPNSVDEKAIKDIPPVPIKTYQWEEVRRLKIKGEYPWTHLVKEPFDPNKMEIETTEVGIRSSEDKQEVENQTENEVKGSKLYIEEIRVIEDDSKTASDVEDAKPELKSALRSSFRETKVPIKNDSEAGTSNNRSKRAKSEEAGKRKRKLSIDSSYSRVSKYSLSKLGAVKKKVKEATDLTRSLIKLPRNPFIKSHSKSNTSAKAKDKKESTETPKVVNEKQVEKKPESVLKKHNTPVQPVYIHIPLKPPRGETDEFSHLEFEQKQEQYKKDPSPIKEEELESPTETPKSVQLIILTAPSDDEILDDVTIPETPSDVDNFFDNKKLEELKTFAKTVADRISPGPKRKNIVIEEVDEPKEDVVIEAALVETPKDIKIIDSEVNIEDAFKVDTETPKQKKIKKGAKLKKEKKITKVDPKIEDEEDGLKTSEVISKEIIEVDIKAESPDKLAEIELNEETSSVCKLKKTVSFNRRSGEKEADYEDIISPDDANKIIIADVEPIKEDVILDLRERGKLETAQSQSMTAEEEKTYLDAKIMKDTSLDEDCSKWSKSIDHEYEPVNPPAESPTPVKAEPPTKTTPITPPTPSTPKSYSYDFNAAVPETNLSQIPVHISSSSLERLASKLAEMDLERTGIKSERQSRTSSPNGNEKMESNAAKIQEALKKQADNIKNQAEKFKIRVKSIKRPNMPKAPNITMPKKPSITLPKRPSINLPKKPNIHMPKVPTFKISKPNVSLPKMSERIKNINFSSLSLPKRKSGNSTQVSTESTATEPKPKKLFDFSTYPRIFRRKSKRELDQSLGTTSTDQRTKSDIDSRQTKSDYDSRKSKDSEPSSVRIPLHSADSIEREGYNREDSVERRMRSSHMQYEDDIDIEDAYMRENQEIHTTADQHTRWTHGSFHQPANEDYNDNNNEETIDNDKADQELSRATADNTKVPPVRGVLEEINQDEFFLRQKGISQDNIEVGAYLSSEIREAFKKQPTTALDQIENEAYFDQNFDRVSNKSLPETPKRKGVKKPNRRKKTPHVSAEAIQTYDRTEEFTVDLHQPERPSRKQRLQRQYDSYEMDTDNIDGNILGMEDYKFTDKQFADMYENEIMAGIDQPNIAVSDPFNKPTTAPRKRNKSHRSQESEPDSNIMIDGTGLGGYESILQRDDISFEKTNTADFSEPPKRPVRTRSRTRSRSRPGEELVAQTASLDNVVVEPVCVEETCIKDMRDNMGYSVISKHRSRGVDKSDLPPPAPRRKSKKDKFSTVPRQLRDESPSRPHRNYSSLVPNRPPRRTSQPNLTDEEKEVDISQYIEIESEDHNRDLHSGKVIQKMKDRPLPAPPRPPRQTLKKSQSPRFEDDEVLETEVSVQTEPLPDDYIVENEEDIQDRVASPVELGEVITAKPTKSKYKHDFDHEETVTHGTLLVQPFTLEDGTEPQEFFSRSTEKFITVRRDYVDDLESDIPDEFIHFRSPGEERIVSIPQVIERIIERPVHIQPDFSSEIELLKTQRLQVGDLDVDNLRVNELQASKITVTEIESSSIQANEINSRGGNLVIGGIELPPSFLQQLLDTIKAANVRLDETREPTINAEEEEEAESGQKKTSIEQVTSASEGSGPKRPPRHQLEPERGQLSRTTSRETDAVITNVDSSDFQQSHVYEDITPLQQIQTRIPSPTKSKQVDLFSSPESVVSDRLSPEAIKQFRDYSIDEIEDTLTSSLQNNEILEDTPQKIERKHKRTISPKTLQKETPPPIPPQPNIYSRYPPAFYTARPEFVDEDIPSPPHSPNRRRRPHHHKIVQLPPESSTDDMTPPISRSSRRSRTPEPSIPELTGQLTRACANVVERSIKRILMYFTNSILANTDGKQDLHVIVVILFVLLAGLLLLGWGDSHDVHHHHWEYFNPPKDI